MPVYDFHCHSLASDGQLSPSALVELAASSGVEWLALTDHDTHAGLEEAFNTCKQHNIKLVAGAEWSLLHDRREYHVLGLGVDPVAQTIVELEQQQQSARRERAMLIGKRLDKAALMTDSYQKACELADSEAPGRPWFARVLIAEQRVRDMAHAFNRFLKKGQSAYVATPWVSFEQGIAIIKAAGGVAVLAHPHHYSLTRTKLFRLLKDFKQLGGEGMEVAVPNLTKQQTALLTDACLHFNLLASGGSDFHSLEQKWLTLGRLPSLPDKIKPLWQLFA